MKNISLPVVGEVSPIVLLALVGAGVALLMNARTVSRAIVVTATDTAAGIIEGIGESVGIPVTDQTQCEKDIAAGDDWAASFSCPAGDWFGAVFDGR